VLAAEARKAGIASDYYYYYYYFEPGAQFPGNEKIRYAIQKSTLLLGLLFKKKFLTLSTKFPRVKY